MSNKNSKSEQPKPKVNIPNIGTTTPVKVDKPKSGHVSTNPPPQVTKPTKK